MASIQGIYIALFGRPADPAGLAFFNEATNNGADLTAIGDLASTAEYQDRFTGMSNEEIVNSIYQSLFERDGEAEGIEFFVNGLEDGTFTINNIAIAILDGAQGTDLDTVNSKIAAADLFLERLDLEDEINAYDGVDAADIVRQFFDSVDTDNVPDEAAIDALILQLLPGGILNPGGGGAGDVVAPVFTSGASALVAENVADDTVVYTATAEDDRGGVQFSLTGGVDMGAFTFDAVTGKLSINDSPDFEAKSSYSVEITATDFSGNATVQAVTINVSDVNEAPVLTVNQTVTTVAENNGKTAIATFTTSDPDILHATWGDVDVTENSTYFSIEGNTLYLNAGVDYEALGAGKSLSVTLTATDGGGMTDTETVTVAITDVAESQTFTYNTVGNKTISSFNAATDTINVAAIDAQLLDSWFGIYFDTGNQAFSYGGKDNGSASYGELVWRHVGGNTIVEADNSRSGVSPDNDLVITITGIHNLTADNFVL